MDSSELIFMTGCALFEKLHLSETSTIRNRRRSNQLARTVLECGTGKDDFRQLAGNHQAGIHMTMDFIRH